MEPHQTQPERNTAESNHQVIQPVTAASNSEPSGTKSSFDFSEVNIMAALSYVGPLVIIPFLTHREDSFVLFHIKQGLLLLIIGLIVHVSMFFLFFLIPFFMLINLGLFVLAIVGIINALRHKEETLPIVGKFASHIKL